MTKINDVKNLNVDSYGAQEARELLEKIKLAIQDKGGRILSGVLTLKVGKDGKASLELESVWRRKREDMDRASDFIKKLAKRAAEDNPGFKKLTLDINAQEVEKHISQYLEKSGNRFGSKSLINLAIFLKGEDASTNGRLNFNQFLSEKRREAAARDAAAIQSGKSKPFQSRKALSSLMESANISRPESVKAQINGLKEAFNELARGGRISVKENESALKYFDSLIEIKQVKGQSISQPPQFVMGDADGSLGRMMLMAMQSGHLTLTREGLEKLALIMNEEAKSTRSPNGLPSFQANNQIASHFDEIMQDATFHKPADGSRLVFLGDIIFDRFTNNQVALADFIRKGHEKGVVFIKGNHDDTVEYEKIKMGGQAGEFCAKKIDTNEAKKLIADCFVNATLIGDHFYCHNGVKKMDDTTFATAFGNISANNAEELAEKMNKIEYNSQRGDFTRFRPNDYEMGGLLNRDGKPVKIVHGHNDDTNILGDVINLNARDRGGIGGFKPAALAL